MEKNTDSEKTARTILLAVVAAASLALVLSLYPMAQNGLTLGSVVFFLVCAFIADLALLAYYFLARLSREASNNTSRGPDGGWALGAAACGLFAILLFSGYAGLNVPESKIPAVALAPVIEKEPQPAPAEPREKTGQPAPNPPKETAPAAPYESPADKIAFVKKLQEQGLVHVRARDYSAAEPLYRERVNLLKGMEGREPALAAAYADLAHVLHKIKKTDEAEVYYHQAVASFEKTGKQDGVTVAVAMEGLAGLYDSQNKLEDIEPLYLRAMAAWDNVRGPKNANTASIMARYSDLLSRLGRKGESERLAASSSAIRKGLGAPPSYGAGSSEKKVDPRKNAPEGTLFISRDFTPVYSVSGQDWEPATERLQNERPGGILAEPEYEGASQRYGSLKLGTSAANTHYFVFDLVAGAHPRFYFDANANGDLTDDPGPLPNQGAGVYSTQIALPLKRLIPQMNRPGDFLLWFFTNQEQWEEGFASHYSRTQLKGKVLIGGRQYLALLMDKGVNDADFTNDGIYLDLDENNRIDRDTEWVAPGEKVLVDDKKYPVQVAW